MPPQGYMLFRVAESGTERVLWDGPVILPPQTSGSLKCGRMTLTYARTSRRPWSREFRHLRPSWVESS